MNTLTILLVTERSADTDRIRAALHDSASPLQLHVVHSGQEALAFLRHLVPHASASRPAFIVLDSTVPYKSRREIVTTLNKDPQLQPIPVVILPA